MCLVLSRRQQSRLSPLCVLVRAVACKATSDWTHLLRSYMRRFFACWKRRLAIPRHSSELVCGLVCASQAIPSNSPRLLPAPSPSAPLELSHFGVDSLFQLCAHSKRWAIKSPCDCSSKICISLRLGSQALARSTFLPPLPSNIHDSFFLPNQYPKALAKE